MTGRVRALAALVVWAALAVEPAAAQGGDPGFRPRHLTLSGGLLVAGGYPVGDRNAELRRNALGVPPPFTLFRADSRFERVEGVEARIAVAVTRAIAVEVGGSYATPTLAVSISADAESPDTVRVTDRVSQYTVDVGAVVLVPRVHLGSRLRPYATAGAGYLRQLHEGRLLLETGRLYHAGGGVQAWLRGGAATGRSLGIRAEGRYVRRTGGVDFEDRSRGYPTFSVLAFAGF